MSDYNVKKMTWQRFIAVLFSLPMFTIAITYFGYYDVKEIVNLNAVSANLICAASGFLAGFMFHNPEEPFFKTVN